jgi:hypothetical protein
LIFDTDLGVEVPAVVIKTLSGSRKGGVQGLYRREVLVFQIHETDNNVGDLDPGVVDIVLDLDALSGRLEDALKRVAEDRISDVADMCGLIRVDGRVLDADLQSV